MARGGPGQQKSGEKQCKLCQHPGRQEADAMLLNGAPYRNIIARLKAAHPGEPELNAANLSRHKQNHLLTQPIKTTEVDPETGQVKEGFIIGHLAPAPLVPKEAIPSPEERVSIPDALAVIINIGVRNAVNNPASVSIKDVIAAMELARKLGLRGDDMEEYRDAWEALGKKKGEMRRRRRKVTVTEETVVVGEQPQAPAEPEATVIDAEVVTPDEWSPDELKLLGGADGPED